MADEKKSEDNINSLCKKYFTPELCKESVTDTKTMLKNKLLTQLVKYGDFILKDEDKNEKSEQKGSDLCEVVIDTIDKCWEKWEAGLNPNSYSAYFGKAVKQNRLSELKKKENRIQSSNLPVYVDDEANESDSLQDSTEDKSFLTPSQRFESKSKSQKFLYTIDKVFRLKKRSDWLKSVLTGELYTGLHAYYDLFPEENIERLSFVDLEIYNWKEKPTQKQVSDFLNKDAGQMNKALNNFLNPIREMLDSDFDEMTKGSTLFQK